MTGAAGTTIWRGRLLVIAAAILWSTSGLFAKAPIFTDWPAETRGILLAFWRAFFAAVILIFVVRRIQWSWKLIPMTLIFAVMNWTYLSALVLCESTLAIWLQYTAPAWVFLISWLGFREHPGFRDWVLLALAAVGVTIILFAELGGASIRGIQYGLASGLSFGLVIVSLRWNREFDAAWLIFLNHAVTALFFLPLIWQVGILPQGQQWFYLVGFGALQMGIPYILFANGLRYIASHEASGLSLLEPLLVPVWVFTAWHTAPDYEYPAATTLVGAAFILGGLLMRYLPRRCDSGRTASDSR